MRYSGGEDGAANEAFWRFSLALYARPGVAPALLALQDQAGREVNLILFGLWVGVTRARRLSDSEWAEAAKVIAGINRAATTPLRRLRRQLKAQPDADLAALRRRVAMLELAGERAAQYRLAAAFAFGGDQEGDKLATAEANLASYLGGEAASAEARTLCRALASLIRRDEA